jgi:hypothetical protein
MRVGGIVLSFGPQDKFPPLTAMMSMQIHHAARRHQPKLHVAQERIRGGSPVVHDHRATGPYRAVKWGEGGWSHQGHSEVLT